MKITQVTVIAMSVVGCLTIGALAYGDTPTAGSPTTTQAVNTSNNAGSSSDSSFVPSLQVGVSTLGIGVHAAGMVAHNVSVRLGGNVYSLSRTQTESDIRYDADLKLQSVDGLVDLYPGSSTAFHLTLGLIDNMSHVHGKAVPASNNTVTINGDTYVVPPGASLNGSVQWSGTKPYIGIGFGRPSTKAGRLSLYADFGAILSDTARVNITSTNIPDPSGTLQTDINAQMQKTQSDLNKVSFYPVAMVGVTMSL